MVDSIVTPTMVKTSRSSLFSSLGKTDAMAMAADAPHIATAPADRTAKRFFPEVNFAIASPKPIVAAMLSASSSTIASPRSATISKLILAPSSATPTRSNGLAPNEIPGWSMDERLSLFSAMPNTSASNMAGAMLWSAIS